MFKSYLKEKSGYEYVELEKCFFVYKLHPFSKTIEIADMYVDPSYRNGIAFKDIYNEVLKIANEIGYTKATCCVELNNNSKPERSIYAILRYKFKISHVKDQIMYFYIDIAEE